MVKIKGNLSSMRHKDLQNIEEKKKTQRLILLTSQVRKKVLEEWKSCERSAKRPLVNEKRAQPKPRMVIFAAIKVKLPLEGIVERC